MEDQGRAAALIEAPARVAFVAPSRPDRRTDPTDGWIVSPAYDLLFIANLGWLLLLLPGMSGRSETIVDFWQVYFLTVPHRWITLILVVLDPDRRGDQARRLAMIGVAALVLVVGIWLGTEALTCLAVIDFLWNAWHFAAQHAGVLRMYSRTVGGGSELLERHGLRLFITYAALRTAGWATGWLEAGPTTMSWLRTVDLSVLVIPVLLIASAAVGFNRARTLHELLGMADVVSIHTELNRETRGMINAAAVAAMKPGAYLINSARGPICDTAALLEGLRSGKLLAVGLDVLPREPGGTEDPLVAAWHANEPWIRGRVILGPHAAFFSPDSFADLRRKCAETVVDYLRDGKLANCVNAGYLTHRR